MGIFTFFKSSGQEIDFNNPEIQKQYENILGKPSDIVLHSPVPFDLGFDIGGGSDVNVYPNRIKGNFYLTTDLTGKKQAKNRIGNYELMIAHPENEDWGVSLISKLSYYTLETSLESGNTMDLGGNYLLTDSNIKALLFSKFADFKVNGGKYGIMLLIGITSDELEWAKQNSGEQLISKLKEAGIYPITDLKRESIFKTEK